jgi:hypothetical protein
VPYQSAGTTGTGEAVITIYYTASVPTVGISSCSAPTITICAQGETPEEVQADLDAKVKLMNAFDVQASGMQNSRADWMAAFPQSEIDPKHVFADTRFDAPPKRSFWKELFR